MPRYQADALREMLRRPAEAPPPTVEQRRAGLDRLGDRIPGPMGITMEPFGLTEDLGGALVRCGQVDESRAVLWFHGGAFSAGSARSHRVFLGMLSQAADAIAIGLDYRLAPEHPFPAAVEDCFRATRWAMDRFGGARLAIGGDSAGANLALVTCQELVKRKMPLPAAQLHLSPYLDLTHTQRTKDRAARDPFVDPAGMDAMAAPYLAGTKAKDPQASPLFGKMNGLPPTLVQVGSDEVLLDDARRLAERMEKAGGTVHLQEWPDMIHVFPMFGTMTDEGPLAVAAMGAFVQSHLSR